MFRRSGKKGNYAYTVARVKAKKSLLMKEEDYNKMLMMSVPEISRYISESGYQKEMTDLAGKYTGLNLLEHATYGSMAGIFGDILSASQGELKDMVSAYLAKWDYWNLKVILRGKSYGLGADGIKEDLVPAGSLSAEDLDKLISYESEDDILAGFSAMVHVTIPSETITAFKAGKNLGIIEDYLDKCYYANLIGSINPRSRPELLFLNYVRQEIDIKNLETILKLKLEGIHGEAAMQYFIPGGKQIDTKLATQLANAETIDAAMTDIGQLDFFESIKEGLESSTSSLMGVAVGMRKYETDQAKKFSHLYPLSVIPVIDFMLNKEKEVKNIRIIARGTDSGLDKDAIKQLLVI
ncbi:MAG: ATP synthase A1 subunit C [Candidatus Methanogranum gryphiswaldense]|nr:MAG: ATP synthase A1 subunit C [Candidatus Methanogranum sp. U3.2.1]